MVYIYLNGKIKVKQDNFYWVKFRIIPISLTGNVVSLLRKTICIYASIRYYQLDKGSETGAGSC